MDNSDSNKGNNINISLIILLILSLFANIYLIFDTNLKINIANIELLDISNKHNDCVDKYNRCAEKHNLCVDDFNDLLNKLKNISKEE